MTPLKWQFLWRKLKYYEVLSIYTYLFGGGGVFSWFKLILDKLVNLEKWLVLENITLPLALLVNVCYCLLWFLPLSDMTCVCLSQTTHVNVLCLIQVFFNHFLSIKVQANKNRANAMPKRSQLKQTGYYMPNPNTFQNKQALIHQKLHFTASSVQ